MGLKSFSSEGIVLSRRNHGEADRILVIFTNNFGKIRLLAKGIRRPKSKKRGHVEVFSKLKFGFSKSKGLGIMTEAEVIDSFESIRVDLKRISVAYFFCEVINRITRDEEKNEILFLRLLNYLSILEKTQKLRSLRENFIKEVLVTLGFWPKGKEMGEPDKVLEETIESRINSVRIARQILA